MTEVAQALRDKTAVCGVGLKMGSYPDRTALSLAVECYQAALDDAGLKREDVDGIIQLVVRLRLRPLSRSGRHRRALRLSGLEPRPLHCADAAARGDGGRPRAWPRRWRSCTGAGARHYGQTADTEMWRQGLGPHGESPAYGALAPVFGAAIAAQRYFHMYGGGNEDLAPIAVAFRKHARLQSERDAARSDDDRGLSEVALDRRAAALVRLLPEQRRRRVHHHHLGRARARLQEAAGLHLRHAGRACRAASFTI